jgi:DNA polymerase-3 subunit chi
MTDIRFYHLQNGNIDQALPAILIKALEQGRRIVVKTADASEAERLNEHLWVYRPDVFIPHGSDKDEFKSDQPVYLTPSDENPNDADVLILTGGAQSPAIADFKLCCEMLDGRDEDAVKTARARWKDYETAGHALTYWQQGAKGWEQKK